MQPAAHIMLTEGLKRAKRNWFLFIFGYFIGGYLLINWINQGRAHYFDVSLSFEKSIPFVPVFILGYGLVYFCMGLMYFLLNDAENFRRAVVSYIILTTLHYIIFLVFPVTFELRPGLLYARGFAVNLTRFYYFIDMPHNCFPSLHVAYPMLAVWLLWRNHLYMRIFFIFMTIIISVSVILVKQHYIMDVLAAVLTAILVYKFVVLTEAMWRKVVIPLSS